MVLSYETVFGLREERCYRNPKCSDDAIENLVERIRKYEQIIIKDSKPLRILQTHYDEMIFENLEKRIVVADIKSADKVIDFTICYLPKPEPIPVFEPAIAVRFNFNSHNENDKPEYFGLVRIVRKDFRKTSMSTLKYYLSSLSPNIAVPMRTKVDPRFTADL